MKAGDYLIILLVGAAILTVFSGRASEIELDPWGGYRINEYNIYLTLVGIGFAMGVFSLMNIYLLGRKECVRLGLSLSHNKKKQEQK